MRKSRIWIGLAGVAMAAVVFSSTARAADSKSPPSVEPQRIALLDVAKIYKNDSGFKTEMAELQGDVERAEASMKKEQTALKQMEEQLKQRQSGTGEFRQLEEETARRKAALAATLDLQRKDFVRREAVIYQRHYDQIRKTVEAYAKENRLAVVIKFDDAPVAPDDPKAVLSALNRQVIWSADSIDITPQIMERLSAQSAPAARPMDGKNNAVKEGAASKLSAEKPAKVSPPKQRRSKAAKGAAQPPKEEKPEPAKPGSAKAAAKKATVVRIRLHGEYSEGPSAGGLLGETEPSLAQALRRLDRAAEDNKAAAVLLEIDDLDIGGGKVNELRAAVARVRKAGKPVYAELASTESSQYLVASACDEVVMIPSGMLLIPGVRAEVTFYKGLLDKLGLQFDALQMGKYKGAAETFTRSGMSPALRESMEAMVDDSYSRLVATIAKDRKLPPDQVKALVDRGLFTAQAAKTAGLVDHVLYFDEFLEILKKKLNAADLNVVSESKKGSADLDFSGVSGFLKFMELAVGGKKSEATSRGRKIAVIYAVGTIIDGESTASLLGEEGLGSRTLVSALKTAADDPKVLAVVLRIDSPGGSAVASDQVWREVKRIKKPVIASMGDVAASGGYYIAMGAEKIYAEPGTITGSIGVIGGKLVLGGLFEKVGVTTDVVSRGKNSSALSSMKPFTKEERDAWTSLLQETYRQFVDKAAQGRKMPREKLEQLAQGRVWTGRMAAGNGLVDALGTLHDAVAEAKKRAGVKADEKIELLILPKPKSIFEQLFSEPSVITERMARSLPAGGELFGQARLLRRLFAQRVLVWMPFGVKIK